MGTSFTKGPVLHSILESSTLVNEASGSAARGSAWRAGSIPWNYPRFLDYAAERILLRKVGGGYIFVHRLLLEYFTSLDSTPALDETRAQK